LQYNLKDDTLNPVAKRILVPMCQCATMTMKPARAGIEITRKNARMRSFRFKWQGRTRKARAPEWTFPVFPYDKATAQREHAVAAKTATLHPLRFQTVDRGAQTNLATQGVSLFGNGCVAPPALEQIYIGMNSALLELIQYLKYLRKELGNYFGSVGSPKVMRELMDSLIVCWDFKKLAHMRPGVVEVRAFVRVFEILHPRLRYTFWPSKVLFPYVDHKWPSRSVMASQYQIFCANLRKLISGSESHKFVTKRSCTVTLCVVRSLISAAFIPFFKKKRKGRNGGGSSIMIRIQMYLFGVESLKQRKGNNTLETASIVYACTFKTQLGILFLSGSRISSTSRYGRKHKHKANPRKGDVVVLGGKFMANHLVLIDTVELSFDAASVARYDSCTYRENDEKHTYTDACTYKQIDTIIGKIVYIRMSKNECFRYIFVIYIYIYV
jgi:hypothetical protein